MFRRIKVSEGGNLCIKQLKDVCCVPPQPVHEEEASEHTQRVYSSVVFQSDATVCRVNSRVCNKRSDARLGKHTLSCLTLGHNGQRDPIAQLQLLLSL